MKSILLFLAKAITTFGLITLVLWDQNFKALAERISELSLLNLSLAMFFLVGQNVIAAIRWIVVMRIFGVSLPIGLAFRFYFEGLFFNQALPSTVGGDGIRMYRSVKAGLPIAAGINGVLLDRIAGLVALLIIVAASQPWLYAKVSDVSARSAFAIIIAIGVIGTISLLASRYLPIRMRRGRVVRGVVGLSKGFWALMRDREVGCIVFGLSLIGHVMTVTAIFILTKDLQMEVSFIDCLILIPGVMLVAALPISIAGWGVRESVMITAMALVNAPAVGSLSLSLVYGVLMVFIGLIGGAMWLFNPDKRIDTLTLSDA